MTAATITSGQPVPVPNTPAAASTTALPVASLRQQIQAERTGARERRHDNIFVERLWWTVKHEYEWVYLRRAANGLEQKRSLADLLQLYRNLLGILKPSL